MKHVWILLLAGSLSASMVGCKKETPPKPESVSGSPAAPSAAGPPAGSGTGSASGAAPPAAPVAPSSDGTNGQTPPHAGMNSKTPGAAPVKPGG